MKLFTTTLVILAGLISCQTTTPTGGAAAGRLDETNPAAETSEREYYEPPAPMPAVPAAETERSSPKTKKAKKTNPSK